MNVLDGIKVVVIEDNLQHIETLTKYLNKLGYQATRKHVTQYVNILGFIKEQNPQLIIIDLQLGSDKLAGAKIAQDIQHHLSHIPIIYYTGLSEDYIEKATDIAWPNAKPVKKITQVKLSKLYDLDTLERAINFVLASNNTYLETSVMTFEAQRKDRFKFETKYDGRKLKTHIHYQNICYIECYKRHIYIHVNNLHDPIISYTRKNLKEIAQCLTPWINNFFPIDKSTIVHEKFIKGVAIEGRARIIYLQINEIEKKLYVARNKVKAFEKWWQCFAS